MTTYIDRNNLPENYAEWIAKESHHDHKIVEINGVLRWEENETVNHLLENISLNDLLPLLCVIGYGKNSEVYRKLYRSMGYSLLGYWEVFHWIVNNVDCDDYKQPKGML